MNGDRSEMQGGSLDRRAFMKSAAVVAGTGATAFSAAEAEGREEAMQTPKVCVFSKHLQFIEDYDELARTCREIGLDGVDLTVRGGGHVLPERVAVDLPRAVEVIRAAGLDVPMITTALRDGSDSHAEDILTAAASLGIQYFRVGGHRYSGVGNPLDQLPSLAEELARLARLAERHGMVAGYHNHSGYGDVGAPVWDLIWLLHRVGSPALGSNFDAGHAKVEGAYGAWKTNARAMAPRVRMMAVKDFVWENDRPRWCPLGQGLVPLTETLAIMRDAGFSGPVSIHMEYHVESNKKVVEEVVRATGVLRKALADAGYPGHGA